MTPANTSQTHSEGSEARRGVPAIPSKKSWTKRLSAVGLGLFALGVLLSLVSHMTGSNERRWTLAEENFLHSVHSQSDTFTKGRTDSDLVQLGHNNCDALDSGLTPDSVGTMMLTAEAKVGQRDKTEDIGAFVGASILTLCPQHTNEMTP